MLAKFVDLLLHVPGHVVLGSTDRGTNAANPLLSWLMAQRGSVLEISRETGCEKLLRSQCRGINHTLIHSKIALEFGFVHGAEGAKSQGCSGRWTQDPYLICICDNDAVRESYRQLFKDGVESKG